MIPKGCEARPFDAEILGHPVWALSDPQCAALAAAHARKQNIGLLFYRGDPDLATQLEPLGFRPVEQLLTFSIARDRMPDSADLSAIRPARPDEADTVAKLAGRSFHTTRWHLDSGISNHAADEFKARWAYNAVAGRALAVPLIEEGGEILGFNAVMEGARGLVIDLIAVAPEARGRGLGRALVCAAFDLAQRRKAPSVRVGTQSVNSASIALYKSLGMREIGCQTTWHLTGTF